MSISTAPGIVAPCRRSRGPVAARPVTANATPAGHGHPAGRTQLPPLGHHAAGDFRDVGDEIGTKPHSVRGAGLARLRGALLSGGAANSHGGDCDEQKPGWQYGPASEVQSTQHFIVSSGVPYGSTARGHTLEHDPKTENQFSEKFRSMLEKRGGGAGLSPQPIAQRAQGKVSAPPKQSRWTRVRRRAGAPPDIARRCFPSIPPFYCQMRDAGRTCHPAW
jgi:hypothetical protein